MQNSNDQAQHPPHSNSQFARTDAQGLLSSADRRSGSGLRSCGFMIGILAVSGVVALAIFATFAPSLYRDQRPEMQAIWCNRATKLKMTFVCDWKPTPPFETIPTMTGPTLDPNEIFLILTPATSTPNGNNTNGELTPTGTYFAPAVIETLTPTPKP